MVRKKRFLGKPGATHDTTCPLIFVAELSGNGSVLQKIQEDDSILPSGYVKIAIENSPFIIDLAIQNGDLL